MGDFIDPTQISDSKNVDLSLTINKELRQCGNTKDMVFSVEEQLAYLSNYFTLYPGDLILTGFSYIQK